VSRNKKLIQKIFAHQQISYKDAEKILFDLGYELKVSGSHHVFRKTGYKHVTLKRRPQLLSYQITILQEVLNDHGIEEKI
jgi:predicted RNA binding protein YcfA (HicA-like mRNA interferase family)